MEPPVAPTYPARKTLIKTMAKEKVEQKKTDREARWEKFLEEYAVQNPVKFASRKANKEFDKIPASFQ